jgi:uncharacterized HAD superfamily protein
MIEDAPEHAHDLAQAGITVLLFDQQWNQNESGENIERVSSWPEIVEKIASKNIKANPC